MIIYHYIQKKKHDSNNYYLYTFFKLFTCLTSVSLYSKIKEASHDLSMCKKYPLDYVQIQNNTAASSQLQSLPPSGCTVRLTWHPGGL